MFPSESYVTGYGSSPMSPSVSVSVMKLGNGYTVQLRTSPKTPKRPRVARLNPLAGADPDEIIDKMVDGMGAFLRSINDRGAGEDWKGSADRQQIREVFKIIFPGVSSQIEEVTGEEEAAPVAEEPKNEHLVFESKEILLKYLAENL